MGIDVAFFRAPDDQAASEAERRMGGPLGWPVVSGQRRSGWFRKVPIVTELGPAFDGFTARGYDAVVNMGTLEGLLTGRDFEAIMEDPRSGGSLSDNGQAPDGRSVITLTDSLRDALAGADDSRLAEVVQRWSRTEELQQLGWDDVSEAEHLEFICALRALALSAKDAGHRLYCYFSL